MKTITIIFFSMLLLSFNQRDYNVQSTSMSAKRLLDTIDTSKYAILKFDKNNGYPFDKTYNPAVLSKKEILKIESLINTAVSESNKISAVSFHIKNTSKYYKQLIGVTNSKGEKEVWVNCFCSIKGDTNWKTQIIGVLDGGSCYFNIKINLTKNTTYDFMINGVA